jgi:hypothetical protein|tara:strand:- start:172 stop:327 length:156 start_codon:yes stop_codon:yes gene_type:complete
LALEAGLSHSKLEQYPETVATIAHQPEFMLKIGIIFFVQAQFSLDNHTDGL